MTREENLHWLEARPRDTDLENECQSKHPIKEALYAARKALEQEPCEDAVSRQAVDGLVWQYLRKATDETIAFYEHFLDLPSVTPQPPKGHWIEHPHECGINWEYSMYECSECHGWTEDNSDFCPNCGVDMREVKE